jgi:hypothetical protein
LKRLSPANDHDLVTVRYQAKVLLRPVAPEEVKIDIIKSTEAG